MPERALAYELGVFWDARDVSAESYGEELFQLCKALAVTDARLSQWNETSDDLPAIVDAPSDLETSLLRHPKTWKFGRVQYHAATAHLTSVGSAGGRMTIDALVGIREPSDSIWFPNRVVLRFWGPSAVGGFEDASLPLEWLDSLVLLFEPRWGALGPDGFLGRASDDLALGVPVVSWMVFLSAAYGPVGEPPPPGRAELVRDGTALISLPGWKTPGVRADDDAERQLRQWMDSRGLRPPAVPFV